MTNMTYRVGQNTYCYEGTTTIEEVRRVFKELYSRVSEKDTILKKVELKAWLTHSESRHKNGNRPFTYGNYVAHMQLKDYIEQIQLGIIDCSDIRDKEEIIAALKSRARVH